MGDNARMTFIGMILVILLGLAAYVIFISDWLPSDRDDYPATTTTPTAPSTPATSTPITSSVRIAFLDTEGVTTGKERGCDRVVMRDFPVEATTSPLTASLQTLFGIATTSVGGYYNFIAKTNGTLRFDHATVESGVAHIYLTGSLSGLAGVCDDPRAAIQIEETALQFPTVQRVQLYLDNATTTLTPSER